MKPMPNKAEPFFTADVVHAKNPKHLRVFTIGLLLLTILLFIMSFVWRHVGDKGLTPLWFLAGIVSIIMFQHFRTRLGSMRIGGHGFLEIYDDKVLVSGLNGWSVDRSRIERALVSPASPKGAWVRLEVTDATQSLDFWVEEIPVAHQIVQQLRLDEKRTKLSRKVLSPFVATQRRKVIWGIVGGLLAFFSATTATVPEVAIPLSSLFVLLGVLSAIPQRLTIGTDAIFWEYLGFSRSIRLEDIEHVEVLPKVVELTVRHTVSSTIKVYIGTRQQSLLPHDNAALFTLGLETSLIAERIRAAKKAGTVKALRLDLSRKFQGKFGDKSSSETLRNILDEQSAYRDAVSADDLWNLVESHQERPLERVIAATALSKTLDDEGKERFRVVVQTAANPTFQKAIESLLDHNDEQLSETLIDLEREENRGKEAAK